MWVFFGIGSANCEAYAILDGQMFVFLLFSLLCAVVYVVVISITTPPLKLHNQKQKQF